MQDTDKTPITNALASEPGYPAETVDGEIVSIVSKESDGQGIPILTGSDGQKYVQQTDAPRLLVPMVEDGVYQSDVNAPLPGPDGTAPQEETEED